MNIYLNPDDNHLYDRVKMMLLEKVGQDDSFHLTVSYLNAFGGDTKYAGKIRTTLSYLDNQISMVYQNIFTDIERYEKLKSSHPEAIGDLIESMLDYIVDFVTYGKDELRSEAVS